MKGKATITDIATAVGVSKTTVSRYINGKQDLLSSKTRTRIEKAIRIAHYHPSAVARSLKTQHSFLIGVIVANITTPFATSLLNGISNRLSKDNYTPIFTDAGDSPTREHELIESLIGHQIDGLIVNTTTSKNDELISLSTTGMPIVLVDRLIDDHTFDIALSSYHEPSLKLMHEIHHQGFGRAVLFTQSFENNSARTARRDAFAEGDLSYFGIKDATRDIYVVDPWEASTVELALNAILDSTPKNAIPAIYATNTVTLIATLNAIRKLKLKIPEQIGICGPDDWGWARSMDWDWASTLDVGITTFMTDPYTMGYEAASLMIARIKDPDRKKETRVIPTKLVIRASTKLKYR
jgi:LacI family kdg operon repressor